MKYHDIYIIRISVNIFDDIQASFHRGNEILHSVFIKTLEIILMEIAFHITSNEIVQQCLGEQLTSLFLEIILPGHVCLNKTIVPFAK